MMDYIIQRNDSLTEKQKETVIALKQQHWPYPYESQKRWMDENLREDDLHILGYINDELVAYLNLIRVDVLCDSETLPLIGVGNVCVSSSYLKRGLGKELIKYVNVYFENHDICGILLCKDSLVSFYQKCNWKSVANNKHILLCEEPYHHHVLLSREAEYSKFEQSSEIRIRRNF